MQFDAHTALRNTEIFSDLDDDALDAISKLVNWRIFNKGVEIVSYKDTARDVYFIADGRVRATIFSFSGKEISYQELGPGSMFGELSAIAGEPRTTNVIVLDKGRIGAMTSDDFWNVIHEYPEVSDNVLKRVANLVRHLCDRVYQYGALDVKDRVRAEVLRLARERLKEDNSAVVDPMPTHAEIASRVNTHREAVTRELNELARLGLISQDKRVLTVADVDALAELMSEDI